jgi:hypothetical protein
LLTLVVVRTPDVYERTLVIPKVATFSMEIEPKTDQLMIWVLGASAWYRIRPSAEYKGHYRELEEKARAWLFLRDKYTAAPKTKTPKRRGGDNVVGSKVVEKAGGEEIKDVWREYANKELSCRTARDASRIFERHRRFLLFMMLKSEGDTEMWKGTPVFRHFVQEYEVNMHPPPRRPGNGADQSRRRYSKL